jgi:hypothetical protein
MWINVSSILLDIILYKRYKSVKDILVLCLYGFLEMLGYRQLVALERLVATFRFWKKGWGQPKRQEIKVSSARETVGKP